MGVLVLVEVIVGVGVFVCVGVGVSVGAGLLGREAIDYFGTPGGFGTRQIGKEQENAAKELAKYKTA